MSVEEFGVFLGKGMVVVIIPAFIFALMSFSVYYLINKFNNESIDITKSFWKIFIACYLFILVILLILGWALRGPWMIG